MTTPVGKAASSIPPDQVMGKRIERRNYSYTSKTVSRGIVVDIDSDRRTIVVEHHVQGKDNPITTRVPMIQAHNIDDVYVNERMLTSAIQYKKHLGVGIPPVPTPAVEYAVISLQELKHFISWVFSPMNSTVLKARGHDGERGCTHRLKDYASRTWSPYRKSADKMGVRGLSKKNYRMMLKLPIFKRVKAEECACSQCVVKGWEGILELGTKLLKELDALTIWHIDAKKVRSTPSSPKGTIITHTHVHADTCIHTCTRSPATTHTTHTRKRNTHTRTRNTHSRLSITHIHTQVQT